MEAVPGGSPCLLRDPGGGAELPFGLSSPPSKADRIQKVPSALSAAGIGVWHLERKITAQELSAGAHWQLKDI